MPRFVADSVIADIRGSFFRADILLFQFFLDRQVDGGEFGTLATNAITLAAKTPD